MLWHFCWIKKLGEKCHSGLNEICMRSNRNSFSFRLCYAGGQLGLSPPCLGICEFLDLWNLGIYEFLDLWSCHNQTIHLFQIFVGFFEVLVLVCDRNNWPKSTKIHEMFRLSQFCFFCAEKVSVENFCLALIYTSRCNTLPLLVFHVHFAQRKVQVEGEGGLNGPSLFKRKL